MEPEKPETAGTWEVNTMRTSILVIISTLLVLLVAYTPIMVLQLIVRFLFG